MSVEDRFDAADGEYLKFDRVENKLNPRPDVHAFIMLSGLLGGEGDMVVAAEHDEIWLDGSDDELDAMTQDQVTELVRCGVRFDAENECLAMFV